MTYYNRHILDFRQCINFCSLKGIETVKVKIMTMGDDTPVGIFFLFDCGLIVWGIGIDIRLSYKK